MDVLREAGKGSFRGTDRAEVLDSEINREVKKLAVAVEEEAKEIVSEVKQTTLAAAEIVTLVLVVVFIGGAMGALLLMVAII
jgi:hypothetical protein